MLTCSGAMGKLTWKMVSFDLYGLSGSSVGLTRTGRWASKTCSGFIYRVISLVLSPLPNT